MRTGKKKKSKGRDRTKTGIYSEMPMTVEGFYTYVETIAFRPPERLKWDDFDKEEITKKFAEDHHLQFKNVSRMFQRPQNSDVKCCFDLFDMIGSTAIRTPGTLYYFERTAENLEAATFLSARAQLVLHKMYDHSNLLSSYVWVGEDYWATFGSNDRQSFKNGLNSLSPQWECALCLDMRTDTVGSTSLWTCFHSICQSCADSQSGLRLKDERATCPVCRADILRFDKIRIIE